MEFSLFYFSNNDEGQGSREPYRILLEGAAFADAHGFAAIWTPERHFHAFGGTYPNPAVTGAAIAGLTKRIKIRAGSVVAPLHHPIRIAEEWSVVDNMSGGRVGISFASGWHPIDFTLSNIPYGDRKQAMLDIVESVRGMWRGDPYESGSPNSAPVRVFPRPVQPELPVWLTSGGTAETFRAAATAKAGVLTHLLHQDVDQLATNIAEYRAKMRATYPDWSGHVVVMLHSFLAETRESARAAVHQPLRDYLRSSLELVARSMRDVGPDFDVRSLEEEDLDFVLERAFSMYFNERGIFGTVDDAVPLVERLREIGVDEIACLIDFGVDVELALEGLHRIDALRRRFAAGGGSREHQ